MTEPTRIVRLLSPEDVRAVLDERDRQAGMIEDCVEQRHSPDDPYISIVAERDNLILQLCHAVLGLYDWIDRLQRENAGVKP